MTLQRPSLSIADRRRERDMQHELLKFHRDRTDPIATALTKKRVRVPRVELETNPFCLERQMADNYQQLNFNKNPRFYSISVQDGARVEQNPHNHSSFINQSADLMASSRLERRARPEFSTLPPATSYAPAVAHFASPKVVSVDPSALRQPHAVSSGNSSIKSGVAGKTKADVRCMLPPCHDQYGAHLTTRVVTFGHRPSSAARMYDHLSNSVCGIASPRRPSSKTSFQKSALTPVKTGMSVMELTQLLAPGKSMQKSSVGSREFSTKQRWKASRTDSSIGQREAFSLDTEVDDELRRQDPDKAKKARETDLEKGFVNSVYNPPREFKPGHFPPPTETTAQLIDKYRKLAVGKLPDEPQ